MTEETKKKRKTLDSYLGVVGLSLIALLGNLFFSGGSFCQLLLSAEFRRFTI